MEQQNNNQERTSKLRNFLEKVKLELNILLPELGENTTLISNPTRNTLLETLYQYRKNLQNTDPTEEITFNEEVLKIENKIRSVQTALGLRLLLQEIEKELK